MLGIYLFFFYVIIGAGRNDEVEAMGFICRQGV